MFEQHSNEPRQPQRETMREDPDARDSTPLRRALAAEREVLDEIQRARAEARSIVTDG